MVIFPALLPWIQRGVRRWCATPAKVAIMYHFANSEGKIVSTTSRGRSEEASLAIMVKSLISPEELEDEEAHVTPHTRRLFADR